MWRVFVQKDVVRGQWNIEIKAFVYWEHYYVLATRGNNKFYIHTYQFDDDWERANKLVERIKSCINFTPEANPTLWIKIVDKQPVIPQRRKLIWWRKW
jgi:hypothetical protein